MMMAAYSRALMLIVSHVHAAAEGKKMFLSGEASFCRLGSLVSGNLVSNNASKIVEISSALGWKRLHCFSRGKSCEGARK